MIGKDIRFAGCFFTPSQRPRQTCPDMTQGLTEHPRNPQRTSPLGVTTGRRLQRVSPDLMTFESVAFEIIE